ncbi:MAG: glycine--tRNA ligase subunit alpha, partial [Nitrospira sp. SB0661_bin_20]|nr:glycine--tRNA ligase subunit alpha [Nitrospira sp. SB0661_bin_20]
AAGRLALHPAITLNQRFLKRVSPCPCLTLLGFVVTFRPVHSFLCRVRTNGSRCLPATTSVTVQHLILSLHQSWAKHGCLICQPYDAEKGTGTFNAATRTTILLMKPEPKGMAQLQIPDKTEKQCVQ